MIKHINKSLLKITMRSVTVVNAVTYNFYAASAAAQHSRLIRTLAQTGWGLLHMHSV